MQLRNERRGKLTISILSLSLLTVMAGAAVAPALDVIQTYFCDVDQLFVQMIISIPALFIVITNMIFPKLCQKFRSRSLLMVGLLFYTVGGCIAGVFSNIGLVLASRALVGIGVGIIMPMSTGLLAFYYTRDKQDRLMGYSSAMNQMGGVIATLLSGMLANISWRASFLVYLMGLISIVLCMLFLPNEYIGTKNAPEEETSNSKKASDSEKAGKGVFRQYAPFIITMFLLMCTFFVYPSSFAMETAKEGVIPMSLVAVIMAGMDLVAFVGGLAFVHIKKKFGGATKVVAPTLFLLGYLLLPFVGGWVGTLLGSACIGFANGLGIPFIISTASQKAGRAAGTTVLPLISAALYLAQFVTPFILSGVRVIFGTVTAVSLPYCTAIVLAVLLVLCSLMIRTGEKPMEACRQEA